MNPVAHVIGMTLLLTALTSVSQDAAIEGTWLTGDGDGLVRITRLEAGLSGIIAGSLKDDPERPDVDSENPDERLRDRPLTGLQIFKSFKYNGKNRWKGGTIYDPNIGKTYRCVITQIDRDTLKVRGYVGVPLFGRTEYWRRQPD